MFRVPVSLYNGKNPLESVSINAFKDDPTQWGKQYTQFYSDDKFCDVTFLIKSSENVNVNDLALDSDEFDINTNPSVSKDNVNTHRFGGHRLLFAAQSEVFKQMLFGSMMESDKSNDVIIHDLNVEQFKWLKALCLSQ